jgi:hypothetical protein
MNAEYKLVSSGAFANVKAAGNVVEFPAAQAFNNPGRSDIANAIERLEAHHEKMSLFVEYVSKSVTPPLTQAPQSNVILKSELINKGSKIAALIFAISIFSWLYTAVPLINPFVSILGLIASPFFYLMSRLIDRKQKR